MSTAATIQIDELVKYYGRFRALSKLTLRVSPGEVFGFLGPNGAGKTTTLRILMGMLAPTSGSASVLGMDCFADRVALKHHIGYLPDTPFFYDYLRGRELLRFTGDMHGLTGHELEARIERLLFELQLKQAADDYVVNYSLGMQKKLGLALALLHEPRVLILDEPTSGLDPHAVGLVRSLLRTYSEQGHTVLLSTHWLELARAVCDRLGIIHQGRLVLAGSPLQLLTGDGCGESASLEDVFIRMTSSRDEDCAGHV